MPKKSLSTYEEIKNGIEHARHNAHGPNKYVIDAMLHQVSAYERLENELSSLRSSIDSYQQRTNKQTRWLIGLTVAIAILTLLMLIGLGIQIWGQ